VVTMVADESVSASFARASYELSLRVVARGLPGAKAGRIDGGGTSCETTCEVPAGFDSDVPLHAVPGPGSTFVRWAGACHDTSRSCVAHVTQAATATAKFRRILAVSPSARTSVAWHESVLTGSVVHGGLPFLLRARRSPLSTERLGKRRTGPTSAFAHAAKTDGIGLQTACLAPRP
jgi:hypothetical protein